MQAINGNILGSTAGSIFKVSSLKWIKQQMLQLENYPRKHNIYVDEVLLWLCNEKKIKCIAVPLIKESGAPSQLNHQ